MKNYHEISASELNENITYSFHLSRKIFLIKKINLETFKHRVANKLLNESILCDFNWNFIINFYKKLDRVTRAICEIC